MSVTFLIKHKSSGKFIHPKTGLADAENETALVAHEDIHRGMHWRFLPTEGIYGYIQHVQSGKVIHPKGGDHLPKDDTALVLHEARHAACLFALDTERNWIIHKSGLKVHPLGGRAFLLNGVSMILNPGEHDAMTWIFMDPKHPEQELAEGSIYGKPTVFAKWEIVNMILNPIAKHDVTLMIKHGKSNTQSSSDRTTYGGSIGFKFKWEIPIKAGKFLPSFKASGDWHKEVEEASSETWSEETTVTRTIHGLYTCIFKKQNCNKIL